MGCEKTQRGDCEVKSQFTRLGLGQVDAMNLLAELGVISDNCITIEDIATQDAEFAADILKTFMTATIPTYTTDQLRDAEAKADEAKEEIEIAQAMGSNTKELESKFSKAHRLVRFLRRRLEDQES